MFERIIYMMRGLFGCLIFIKRNSCISFDTAAFQMAHILEQVRKTTQRCYLWARLNHLQFLSCTLIIIGLVFIASVVKSIKPSPIHLELQPQYRQINGVLESHHICIGRDVNKDNWQRWNLQFSLISQWSKAILNLLKYVGRYLKSPIHWKDMLGPVEALTETVTVFT